MATIENRNGKYRVKIRKKGKSLQATFAKYADAKAWAIVREAEIVNGVYQNITKDCYFIDILDKYLNEITPKKRGQRAERYMILRIKKTFIANILASELCANDFGKWRDKRLKEVSASTVLKELATMSAICTIATKEWGLMRENPIRKISKPKDSAPRTRRPTHDEIRRLLLAFGYDEDKTIDTVQFRVAVAFLFAMETAMRAGEICGLKWQDIDFNRRLAHLAITKNGHSRDVPLSKRAIELLQKLQGIDDTSVFNVKSGSLDALFRKIRDKCQIVDLHFHDTRREALTRLSKKVDVMTLAKISGHRDVRILLNTYYSPDMSNVADLLD